MTIQRRGGTDMRRVWWLSTTGIDAIQEYWFGIYSLGISDSHWFLLGMREVELVSPWGFKTSTLLVHFPVHDE